MPAIDASVLAMVLEIIRLATSRRFAELDGRGLISKISRSYIETTVTIVDGSRYRIPSNISDDEVSIVEFSDRRGISIEIPIKVSVSTKDDLVEIIFGFELLKNGELRLANAYW